MVNVNYIGVPNILERLGLKFLPLGFYSQALGNKIRCLEKKFQPLGVKRVCVYREDCLHFKVI